MAVLVCGGAGYIGSHTVSALRKQKEEVVVFDNLEKGHVQAIEGVKLFRGDLRNIAEIRDVFSKHDIEGVIHFAAYIEVGESVRNPLKYYNNNVISALNLLTAMNDAGVKKIVFSSTAAVYGEVESVPIMETAALRPSNPYGETKLSVEKALHWSENSYGIRHVILRYFNACGAHPDGHIGEDHDPESHLIPLILQVPLGKSESIKIFGVDYPTEDGSCERDYVHVCDLAQAHTLALQKLRETDQSRIYNLGNGKGFSVKQVVELSKKVTGLPIKTEITARRPGDPPKLVASSAKARNELGWKPEYSDLETIIAHAWSWHKNHPEGFSK